MSLQPKILYVSARDQEIPVEAWDTHVPGLAVTAVPTTEMESGYRVTHEASGHAISVTVLPTIDIAFVFADLAKDVTDWTMSKQEFADLADAKKEPIRAKIRKIAEAITADLEKNPAKLLQKGMELKQQLTTTEG